MVFYMKTVFISYFRSEVNKEKLDRLIKLLEESDIRVIIDERNLEIGGDLPLFMEKNLVESDFIIVILTSGYKKRADDREGGVGYEAAIMAASLSKRETIKKFLPVTFETYRDEIVPVFLASKLASDLSDNLDSITFKGAVKKLKRTILGISMTSQPTPKAGPSKVVRVADEADTTLISDNDNKNTQIMLISIDSDEVTQPRNDGAPGSALYEVPFRLNHYPNRTWQQLFLANWRSPSQFTLMHRGNIAKISGDRIILDGTTIEEVRDYHLKTLKIVIQDTNKQYKRLMIKEQQRLDHDLEIKNKQRDKVRSVINDLRF
ncbi:TIR domain-containing protein [Bifidobacterium longum]|uniref:TIR domain-containing protein n=1 Tax=Bifidobacterium longum TaxID=216816 RepID=A0A6B1XHK0_BIFLN|nr:TIR domain-containing protein [Bifidobacterium longum]